MRGKRFANRSACTFLVLWMVLAVPSSASHREDLARRFAPVIVQDCASRADYITRFDFDGDWNGRNNWENLTDSRPLPAFVYFSVIETVSHYYFTYSLFHPRDYYRVSIPGINHENDLEGVLVVVEKQARGKLKPILVEAVSHGDIQFYSSEPSMAGENLEGDAVFEGDRVWIRAAAFKHPIHALQPSERIGSKSVVDRFKGVAQEPRNVGDKDVGYDLRDVYTTLWAHRLSIGSEQTFGEARTFMNGTYGAAFRGDNYKKNSANPPWQWKAKIDGSSGLPPGTWFLDPARAMRVHYPKQKTRFSLETIANPYRPGYR
jgi:hypothetical protein